MSFKVLQDRKIRRQIPSATGSNLVGTFQLNFEDFPGLDPIFLCCLITSPKLDTNIYFLF